MRARNQKPSQLESPLMDSFRKSVSWQWVGFMLYVVLLVSGMACGVVLMAISPSIPSLNKQIMVRGHTPLSGYMLVWAELTIAAPFVGTLIGVPISRLKLRWLCKQLTKQGEDARAFFSPLLAGEDKELRCAARYCLEILEGGAPSPSNTLLRASLPDVASDVLLRPASDTDVNSDRPQHLLRATANAAEEQAK